MIRNVLLLFMLGILMVPTDVVAVAETTNMRCVVGDTNRTVEGVVVDEEGKPLQGVHILVLETYQIASQDEQGHFSLDADTPGTLCFSCVGRKMQQVAFEPGMKNLKVVMSQTKKRGKKNAEGIFTIAHKMPKFKNGDCYKYLVEKVREVYPLEGQSESGKVFVGFVIDRFGNVTNPKVIISTCRWWNEEALRIVSEMPRWKPGRMNGKAVDVYYIVPLNFFPYMYW